MMTRYLCRFFRGDSILGSRMVLACSWVCGLVCGLSSAFFRQTSFISVMRGLSFRTVSIVGVICVFLLPFLISAIAVSISKLWLIYPVCFCKAYLFMWVSWGILMAYPENAWGIRLVIMFADCCLTPLLYGFWLLSLDSEAP